MTPPYRYLTLASTLALGSFQNLQGSTVSNAGDSGPGSLRASIAAAVNGETISFDPALNGATITLTSGSLSITGLQLTIDGSSLPLGIQISGNDTSRILTIVSNSNVALKHLTLRNGRAVDENGGALLAQGGQLQMTDCSISASYSSLNGGGAYIGNGIQATVERCSFVGNHGEGFGGGIFFIGTSSAIVTNTVISGNRSLNGGGILNLSDSPSLVNCTIQGNFGGGIQNEFSSAPLLRNTIVTGNRIGTGTGPIASQQLKNNSTSAPDINHCLIEDASSSASFDDGNRVVWGANNLAGSTANDPAFLEPVLFSSAPNSAGDLRVLTTSPVLNVGDNLSNSTNLDRAGKPRIQGTTIDLGAFEAGYVTFSFLHPSLAKTGDENQNGLSNFVEYALGNDPSASDDQSSLPTMSNGGGDKFITASERVNAADVHSSWVTSTDLASLPWQPMIEGVNYSVESTVTLAPGRQQMVIKLLDTDPRRFYRKAFADSN